MRLALAALAAMLLLAAPAQAIEIRVTTTQDDGSGCDPIGRCTLRGAVQLANDLSGPDTIVVPEGLYALQAGDLDVFTEVTITGAGARTTTIDATAELRVFNLTAGAATTISHLTMQGGTAANGQGGNLVNSEGTVTLDHVRITGGAALFGGGAANVGGTMTIDHSLLDGNSATWFPPQLPGEGGALANLNSPAGTPGVLTVRNTTLTGNDANLAGALTSPQGTGNQTTLLNVTIARNTADRIGGIAFGAGSPVSAEASVIADNTAPNCSPALTNRGHNVGAGVDCGFSVQNIDPMLGARAPSGGETDVMPLLPGSPALDIQTTNCTGTDQRGVPRPQGTACDAGAFELEVIVPPPPPPPPPPPSNDADRDGVIDPSDNCPANPNTDQADADNDRVGDACEVLPSGNIPPRAGVSTTVRLVSGEVFVKLPASASASDWRALRAPFQESGFVPLKGIASVPVRSVVDARKGRIALEAAANSRPVGDRRRRLQAAQFAAGMFRIRQQRARRASNRRIATDAELVSAPGAQRVCARRPGAGPPKGVVRRLSATGKGLFRAVGGASLGIARSATWITTDRCDGTLTEVGRGRVTVRAKAAVRRRGRGRARRRTVTVRAGRAYLVRARLFAVRKGRDRPGR